MTESVSYLNTNTGEAATENSSKSLILVNSRHRCILFLKLKLKEVSVATFIVRQK